MYRSLLCILVATLLLSCSSAHCPCRVNKSEEKRDELITTLYSPFRSTDIFEGGDIAQKEPDKTRDEQSDRRKTLLHTRTIKVYRLILLFNFNLLYFAQLCLCSGPLASAACCVAWEVRTTIPAPNLSNLLSNTSNSKCEETKHSQICSCINALYACV